MELFDFSGLAILDQPALSLNIRVDASDKHFQGLVAVAAAVTMEVEIDYLQLVSEFALKNVADIFSREHGLFWLLVT